MKRACEALLLSHLQRFPCVALIGLRQCGKTTLLHTLPKPWKHYDLERQADYEVVARDPDAFFRLNTELVALDEVQVAPQVFPALRVAIDADRSRLGRYVITGSSSPTLLRSVSESLAGRVAIIEMAPFSWEEVTETSERDSLLRRLKDRKTKPVDLVAELTARGSVQSGLEFWFRGGFPEPWLRADDAFRRIWVEQYLQTYLYRDVKRLFPGLDEIRFRRFIEMLGGLSGRIINYAEAARALAVSQPTARDYFEIAHGTFLWRRIPAFSRQVLKRTVKHPRGYLRDTGLLHALLRLPDSESLLSHPQVRMSWEGMVIEEIIRQLNAAGIGHDYSYYRTGAGAEVDLLLEGDFGLVAVEIKHSSSVGGRDLRVLREVVRDQGARLGLVINNDVTPREYADDLIGLPFHYL